MGFSRDILAKAAVSFGMAAMLGCAPTARAGDKIEFSEPSVTVTAIVAPEVERNLPGGQKRSLANVGPSSGRLPMPATPPSPRRRPNPDDNWLSGLKDPAAKDPFASSMQPRSPDFGMDSSGADKPASAKMDKPAFDPSNPNSAFFRTVQDPNFSRSYGADSRADRLSGSGAIGRSASSLSPGSDNLLGQDDLNQLGAYNNRFSSSMHLGTLSFSLLNQPKSPQYSPSAASAQLLHPEFSSMASRSAALPDALAPLRSLDPQPVITGGRAAENKLLTPQQNWRQHPAPIVLEFPKRPGI